MPQNGSVGTVHANTKIAVAMRTELNRSGLLGGNKASDRVCLLPTLCFNEKKKRKKLAKDRGHTYACAYK